MANIMYDLKYGKGATNLFGEELLSFASGEHHCSEEKCVLMELELIKRLKILNSRYRRNMFNISTNLELCEQFWDFYRVGITFLARFLGHVHIKNETREELSYYLLDYLVDGNCKVEFVRETFTCMVLVKGDLDFLLKQ